MRAALRLGALSRPFAEFHECRSQTHESCQVSKRVLVARRAPSRSPGWRRPPTFPAPARPSPIPIYSKWADAYKTKTGIGLNYQSIGSGGGIKQIKAKTVTFGASDMPLKPEELKEAGLVQFPMIIGGVVPVVNIKGVRPGSWCSTAPRIASIYLGEITKWNDPRSRS